MWGSIKAHGFLPNTVIVSDDAGQFNVGQHGLCWVHAERLVHKLDTFTDEQRIAQRNVRATASGGSIAISRPIASIRPRSARPPCGHGSTASSAAKPASSPSTACSRGSMPTKRELLMVLDRPEIPLHTNGSENDIRCQVTKRKISGGTRSDTGRDCRDAFLGLAKTCAKLGIAFWDYLGARLAVPTTHMSQPCRTHQRPRHRLTATSFAPLTKNAAEPLT